MGTTEYDPLEDQARRLQTLKALTEDLTELCLRAEELEALNNYHGCVQIELNWYKKHYLRVLYKQIRDLGGEPKKLRYKDTLSYSMRLRCRKEYEDKYFARVKREQEKEKHAKRQEAKQRQA